VLNRQRGVSDRLATAGLEIALRLPEMRDAERLEGRLAQRVMGLLYPYYRPRQRWPFARRNGRLSKQDQSLLARRVQVYADLTRVRAEIGQINVQLEELGFKDSLDMGCKL